MARLAGFRSVRGHGAAVALLRRAVEGARVSSVYLFAGPAGVGKDRLAHALAQVMNCTDRTADGDACGACVTCSKIARALHPDLIVLQRELKEPPEDSKQDTAEKRKLKDRERARRLEDIIEADLRPNITVGQIDELQASLPFRPHEARTRWVIFREAEKLLPAAANKLLKTLEEPPTDTHFVLLSSKPSSLLPTIRSRCQTIRFGLLSRDDVSAVLREGLDARERLVAEGKDPPDVFDFDRSDLDTLTGYSDGSVGRALEFKNKSLRESREGLRDEILEALRAGLPGAYVSVGEQLKKLKRDETSGAVSGSDRHELDAVLMLLFRHFRHEALQLAHSKPRHASIHAGRAEIVRETQALLDGSSNLNPQLFIEAMLVRLREVRA